MRTLWSLIYFLVCNFGASSARVINAEHDAHPVLKTHAAILQAFQWMSDIVAEEVPRPPKRVQLAVVGLGRTGSTSFAAALKELDFTPVHDDEMAEVADIYGPMMSGAISLDQFNIDLGNRGFDAPVISVHKYVEWAAKAPGIKVILTVRDKKKWAESWLAVTPLPFLLESRPFKWFTVSEDMLEFTREVFIKVPTNGKLEHYQDIPTLEAGYDAWVDFVRKTVPAERLLEFDVKQGWEPLCKFLGKPIPSQPFPHVKDRVVIDTIIKVFVLVSWVWPLVLASPLLFLWCGTLCCNRLVMQQCCCCRKRVVVDFTEMKKRA